MRREDKRWPRICVKCGKGTALFNCRHCMCLDWTRPNKKWNHTKEKFVQLRYYFGP